MQLESEDDAEAVFDEYCALRRDKRAREKDKKERKDKDRDRSHRSDSASAPKRKHASTRDNDDANGAGDDHRDSARDKRPRRSAEPSARRGRDAKDDRDAGGSMRSEAAAAASPSPRSAGAPHHHGDGHAEGPPSLPHSSVSPPLVRSPPSLFHLVPGQESPVPGVLLACKLQQSRRSPCRPVCVHALALRLFHAPHLAPCLVSRPVPFCCTCSCGHTRCLVWFCSVKRLRCGWRVCAGGVTPRGAAVPASPPQERVP